MRNWNHVFWGLAVVMLTALSGCGDGNSQPQATPTSAYVGSDACQNCHADYYADFIDSGHPYKLNKVVGAQVPSYPFSSIDGALEQVADAGGDSRIDKLDGDAPLAGNGPETDNELGTPDSYADVSYVIGGYGWKARWIDLDGFIVTGTAVQYNLENGAMAGYHNDEANKVYNCGNCHTTGWQHYDETLNPSRQDDLPGMDGTFAAAGIQCESCHGAGGAHVDNPSADNIVRNASARTTADFLAEDMAYGRAVACSECHTRDGEKDYPGYVSAFNQAFPDSTVTEGGRIAASGGLGKHHEQYDELLGIDPATGDALGKHLAAGVGCVDCHDPHKSTKYQDQTGEAAVVACDSCHGPGTDYEVAMPSGSAMAGLDCSSCHMPLLAKSAVKHDPVGTGPATGDIKSHIFKIDLTRTEQLTADGSFVNPWITKDFACGTCHNGVDSFDLSQTDLSGFTFHQATVGQGVAADAFDNEYASSKTCGFCHETKYDDFIQSGHPYKLNKVVDAQVPSYPFSDITGALAMVTDEDGVTDNSLGTPGSYADISYVIGGYGWKSRWIDADGFIVTGSAVQYNLEDGSMAAYHDNEVDKPYNCGNCHTTGWQHFDATLNPERQDDLLGMDGTFAETGIGCESCHGAALRHVFTRDAADVTQVATARTTADFLAADMAYGQAVACGECHTRDGEKDHPSYLSAANNAGYAGDQGGRIVSNGTIAKHHEQYDELLGLEIDNTGALTGTGPLGKHLNAGVSCTTCHDPHKTTKYQAAGALKLDCTSCHANKASFTVGIHDTVATDCLTCHMPKLAKSAIWTGTNAAGKDLGDIKSHIFKIDLSKTAQLTDDNAFVYPWITPDYSCGECHSDPGAKVDSLNTNYGGLIHSN